jgi:uncharacterized protein
VTVGSPAGRAVPIGVAALAALPFLVVPSSAGTVPEASFACDRPGTIDEQVICSDALLRGADAALDRQFAALLAATEEAVRRESIRADEHGWILRRNRECGATAGVKLTDAERPLLVDCFLAAYDERAADLDRMRREPIVEPGEVSSPIRRSMFGETKDVGSQAGIPMVDTGLVALEGDEPVFAWRSDGALLVLGRDEAKFAPGLWEWRAGTKPRLVSEAVADPERIERICLAGEDVLLVPRLAGDPPLPVQLLDGKGMRLVNRRDVPGALAMTCGLWGRRRLVTDAEGKAAVALGALDRLAGDPEDRYVQFRRDDGGHRTTPPIRIDRRMGLRAEYAARTAEFVVSAAHRPMRGEAGFERVWAKTGCLPFWRVSAADGSASQGCIPFGDYVGHLPQPLPSPAGLFVAAEDAGLYRIEGETARRVVSGPVEGALIAPDGCQLAVARSYVGKSRPKRGREVAVANLCPAG